MVGPRDNVKIFPNVNETKKDIGFIVSKLLCNDPKLDKVVQS
jgi:hypothetical protein